MADFEVSYQVGDGYCGGARPQQFTIDDGVLDPEMSEDDICKVFWEEVEADMRMKVHPICGQENEFVEWAKERIREMQEDD